MIPRRPDVMPAPTDVVEFVIHGALAPRVIDWLNAQGFDVINWPARDDEPDRLPCFMVTPGEDLMRTAMRTVQ